MGSAQADTRRPDEWYTNRELLEMISDTKEDLAKFRIEVAELRTDLRSTREIVRKYNGLREDLDTTRRRVDAIEQQAAGRSAVGKAIREWGGWIIAVVGFLAAYVAGGGITR